MEVGEQGEEKGKGCRDTIESKPLGELTTVSEYKLVRRNWGNWIG